jgi:branched-chain amino acid aminotransferase
MPSAPRFAWMNGGIVAAAEANVSFINAGLHYGISVFEGIRCYATDRGPAIFRLAEHAARLFDSAHILGFRQLPFSLDDLVEAIKKTVAANGFGDCYVRPLVYLDGAMNMVVDAGTPKLAIAVWEWANFFTQEAKEKGVRANISSFTRHHPNVMMTKAKISGNYVNSVLAKTDSLRLGFDEAIMLDPEGYVAECTGENLFIVRRGRIYTPNTAVILEGITRDTVFTLAGDLGYTIMEEPISRDQLYIADEVFVCGTAAEVVSLREIDGRQIARGEAGSVTRALRSEFESLTRGRHRRSAEWLTPVANVPAGQAARHTA